MSLARFMRHAVFGVLSTVAAFAIWPSGAEARVVAHIAQSKQSMQVFVDGVLAHVWPVSTARRGYTTPNGVYRIRRMVPMWYSRKYHMSPMPHAMFFRGGYAIHGTYAVGNLGRRASHGCIRLAPRNARALHELTRTYGGTRIVIQN